MRALVPWAAALVLCGLVAGLGRSLAGNNDRSSAVPRAKNPWLVLSSTRDGLAKEQLSAGAYSMRSDGSRLTALLDRTPDLYPLTV
jgi:hypothetical protein